MVPSLRDPSTHRMLPSSRKALEARIETLSEALEQLEARVRRLEGYGGVPSAPEISSPEGGPPEHPDREDHPSASALLGMAGQVCLILGGAFLLRTLTDGGTIPRPVGMTLGLVYATAWALVASRVASPLHAAFYALSSILITYPLLWESTTTFAILSPPWVAGLLLLGACLHVGVAWLRSIRTIAWVAALSVLGVAFGLMVSTQAVEWFVALFLALGAGSLWLTYGRRWHALRWPAALAADLAVLVLAVLTAWPGGPPEGYRSLSPPRSMALALGLVAIYLGSFATRMLQRRRTLNAFEAIQTALVLAIGFGGAVRVALASGAGAAVLGSGVLVAGLGCGAAAYPFAGDQEDLRANFSFFTTLALVFLLLGGPIVLPRPAYALSTGFLGLGATLLGVRLRRTVLLLQGAVSLTAGALASGLLTRTFAAFLRPVGELTLPSIPALTILTLLALAHALLMARRPSGPLPWRFRLPSFLLGTEAVLGAITLAVWIPSQLLGGGRPDPGLLAAFRTGALSAAAIGIAALGRRHPASELRWLVYPLLALAALKFLLEDLPAGRPLTWFLAFMVYGSALILAPRFLKAPPSAAGNM